MVGRLVLVMMLDEFVVGWELGPWDWVFLLEGGHLNSFYRILTKQEEFSISIAMGICCI